ncbi:MAG TPA: GntR family transcriptional regulator [Candidatus Sulfotelmatobacter sp.]|jgi:GntR family transcriptional regulator|nr:GntR family transcriptional regulator [Candidatus Sulfotelmatobacter sp.]
MQLWFARGCEVSIREQLVTQVVLGILSDDLAPGQRLPSTRELARRFHLHPNTVSAGYRQLERDRWVEFRRGSGVYIRASKPELPPSPALALDQMIAKLFRSAQTLGVSLPALRERLRQWLELQPPDHFLLIEPEVELRRILAAEIARAVSFPVKSCGTKDCPKTPEGGIPVVLPNRASTVRELLPPGTEVLALQVSSVPSSIAGWLPAPSGTLVGVASRSPDFLKMGRAVLHAAGLHPDSLVFRDAREPNWQRGLKQTAAVVCDSLLAADLPEGCRAIPFSLVSEASIAGLRRYEEFIRQPIETL